MYSCAQIIRFEHFLETTPTTAHSASTRESFVHFFCLRFFAVSVLYFHERTVYSLQFTESSATAMSKDWVWRPHYRVGGGTEETWAARRRGRVDKRGFRQRLYSYNDLLCFVSPKVERERKVESFPFFSVLQVVYVHVRECSRNTCNNINISPLANSGSTNYVYPNSPAVDYISLHDLLYATRRDATPDHPNPSNCQNKRRWRIAVFRQKLFARRWYFSPLLLHLRC